MKKIIRDTFGNELRNEEGQIQYEHTNIYFQCGSCDSEFTELKENCCPDCGSGNWVQGCIDYPMSCASMTKEELIKTVNSLLSAVEDDCLSPDDFMERLNDTYKHFGEVTHENMKGR